MSLVCKGASGKIATLQPAQARSHYKSSPYLQLSGAQQSSTREWTWIGLHSMALADLAVMQDARG